MLVMSITLNNPCLLSGGIWRDRPGWHKRRRGKKNTIYFTIRFVFLWHLLKMYPKVRRSYRTLREQLQLLTYWPHVRSAFEILPLIHNFTKQNVQ